MKSLLFRFLLTLRLGSASAPIGHEKGYADFECASICENAVSSVSAIDGSATASTPIQLLVNQSFPQPLPGIPLPNTPLRPFSVSQPLLSPALFPPGSREICTQALVTHTFAFSYGLPAIVSYAPPTLPQCGEIGRWARVVLTLMVTSNGTQYDRLSSVYLHGVEIWRTSTPEPTYPGIEWTAEKDITHYKALLSQNGTLVLDLENFYDPSQGLTGIYIASLNISYVASSEELGAPLTADLILPLSLNRRDAQSLFRLPPSAVTLTSFPINGFKAIVEIYASGNGLEEYWYGNVPDEYFTHLPAWEAPDGDPNPHGPFREVQLLIDGVLAGVIFPYPVIYSGQFLPTLWRPLLSHGSFDSPTYFIDITPFIPSLSDGKIHNFTLCVVGQEANRTINNDWLLTGNVQVFLDESDLPTTGKIITYSAEPFATADVAGTVNGTAPDVYVTTHAGHSLTIEAELTTGSGITVQSSWWQELNFENTQTYERIENGLHTQLRGSSPTIAISESNNDLGAGVMPHIIAFFGYDNPGGNQTFYDYDVTLNQTYIRAVNAAGISGMFHHFNVTQNGSGTQSRHQTNITIRTGRLAEIFLYHDLRGDNYFRVVDVATWANTTSGLGTVDASSVLVDREGGTLVAPAAP